MSIKRNRGKKNYLFYKYLLIFCIVLTVIIAINKIGVNNTFFVKYIKDKSILVYSKIISPIESFKSIKNINILMNLNDDLSERLSVYYSLEEENKILQSELDSLNKLLKLNNDYKDYIVNAMVIMRNNDFWYNTLTINKGEDDGVKIGDVVISYDGLVGKIISVSKGTSVVLLITSNENKISANVISGEKSFSGDITLYEDNLFTLYGIDNYSTVNVNDAVKTSVYSSYGEGFLIGRVSSISFNSYKTGKIIKITPSVNFDELKYVSIIRGK